LLFLKTSALGEKPADHELVNAGTRARDSCARLPQAEAKPVTAG
jgi:hypothetical protein